MRVLGIETSCDETGIAIYDTDAGLLSHVLHSQIPVHAEYGGVVPELASRDHVRKLIPLADEALTQAGCKKQDIDAIAYTQGPGLVGALLVGTAFARTLAFAWGCPSVGVHHMEAHLLAPMLEETPPEFPFVALIVSGGHSLLVDVEALGRYKLLGETIDDACGEAFDKTAKMMGLGYPGGPLIAALADKGSPDTYTFPRPMVDRPGLDFSFSGLKTFALNTWEASAKDDAARADIARAFQDAVVDTMVIKCKRALKASGMNRLVVAGGVGANRALRTQLKQLMSDLGGEVYYPRPEFCTDNGAMVAYAGAMHLLQGERAEQSIQVKPRWPLSDLLL